MLVDEVMKKDSGYLVRQHWDQESLKSYASEKGVKFLISHQTAVTTRDRDVRVNTNFSVD